MVTHAHLDHCGYLPVLARSGFTGPVVCTADTARLAAIVLRDAAHLQEEEARWAVRSGTSKHASPRPLFDTADAERVIGQFDPVTRDTSHELTRDLSVTLRRAGHILGSSFAAVNRDEVRIVFSGDLGRPDHPLLLPPEAAGPADYFVVESTYGDRHHDGHGTDDLRETLVRTLGRGGVALIPAFAVDRTALLLNEIRLLVESGRVPRVPVYVDSPMALAALEVYRMARFGADSDFRPELTQGKDPFDPGELQLVHGPVESEKLNDPRHPCIVISASGMATGGRVLHHLEHQLPRSRNTVILTGYQVAGSRGRALADGAPQVKIHGRYIPVRAEIANIRGFSAHADSGQLLDWLRASPEPQAAFVVHGEPQSSEAFATKVRTELGWTAVVPGYQERVRGRLSGFLVSAFAGGRLPTKDIGSSSAGPWTLIHNPVRRLASAVEVVQMTSVVGAVLSSAGSAPSGGVDVLLADGRIATVRSIRPSDHDALVALHESIGDASIRLRFFSLNRTAGRTYAEHLSAGPEDGGPITLVALLDDELVAVASAEPGKPEEAEVAFLVADRLHGLGLGTLLLEHLAAAARDRGIQKLHRGGADGERADAPGLHRLRVRRRSHSDHGVVTLRLDTAATERAVAAADLRERQAEARSLAPLLYPSSVAVVGVRRDGGGVGRAVLEELRLGGFAGEVYVVHPNPRRGLLGPWPCLTSRASAGRSTSSSSPSPPPEWSPWSRRRPLPAPVPRSCSARDSPRTARAARTASVSSWRSPAGTACGSWAPTAWA